MIWYAHTDTKKDDSWGITGMLIVPNQRRRDGSSYFGKC